MKLYDFTIAPNPRRVRIFLAEKGIEIPTVQVDLREGQQFDPEFRQKSPLCDVPLLELDDGQCISQVNAICRYIEARYPEHPLLGETPEQIALIEMWNHIAFINGISAIGEAFRNGEEMFRDRPLVGRHNYEQIPALVERGRHRTLDFFADINERLGESEYLAGGSFSAADITALVAVDFAKWIDIEIPGGHSHLLRWYERVSQRPSAQA